MTKITFKLLRICKVCNKINTCFWLTKWFRTPSADFSLGVIDCNRCNIFFVRFAASFIFNLFPVSAAFKIGSGVSWRRFFRSERMTLNTCMALICNRRCLHMIFFSTPTFLDIGKLSHRSSHSFESCVSCRRIECWDTISLKVIYILLIILLTVVAPLFLSWSCFAKCFHDLTTNTAQFSDIMGCFGDGNSFFRSDKWQGLTMLMNRTCNCMLVHLCSHILKIGIVLCLPLMSNIKWLPFYFC